MSEKKIDRFTSRELEIMTVEIMMGKKHSLKGDKFDRGYKDLEASIQAQLKYGIPVGIAPEIPDIGED